MAKLVNSGQKTMQPTNRVNIRFILHQPGPRSKEGVLYVRVTVDGVRAPEKSTGIKIVPKEWDSKKQSAIGKTKEAGLLNSQLDHLKIRFREAQSHIALSGDLMTAKKLLQVATGEKPASQYTLKDMYDRLVREKSLTSQNSKSTYDIYERYFSNIGRYLEESGQKNLLLNDIDNDVYLDLIEWLKERYKDDYAKKIAQFFRTLYTHAHSLGYVDRNPLKLIRLEGSGEYDTTHLDQDEIKRLIEFDFSGLALKPDHVRLLEEERDVLVFTSYTGLHHSDFVERGYEMTEFNGRKWIEGYRVKSKGGKKDKHYQLPIHPYALDIIDKYNGIHKLPVRSNHKRNLILKEIAAHVGIDKNITTKIGRKSLTDYCLNVLGMQLEDVAEILGHRSTNYIKHYAKIRKERLDKKVQFNQGKL